MISALRISVCERVVTENVQIFTLAEQKEKKIPNLFEEGQICYRDNTGQYYLSDDDMVSLIFLRKAKPTSDYIRVKRLLITWDEITFAPAWILPNKHFNNYKVPNVFIGLKQFCFVADNHLILTKDDRVGRIEL
jgi:hypothetical protein